MIPIFNNPLIYQGMRRFDSKPSVNQFYTFNYSQPEEYRFSHDSVFLARFAFELMRDHNKKPQKILDLCAGCGIVGLDFLFHLKTEMSIEPEICDFLEIQEIYQSHFQINADGLKNSKTKMNFILNDYAEVVNSEASLIKYDLILCNPPYFMPGTGKLSPSHFKNRCRFFIDSPPENLFELIASRLNPNGMALVLCKSEYLSIVPERLDSQVIGNIRGTPVVRLLTRP